MQVRREQLGRLAGLSLAVLFLLPGALQANLGIKPAFVEVNMDQGRPAGAFLIANLGDKEERFRIKAVHFLYTEQGVLKRSPTGDYSLAPWTYFNPRELTLAPKTQRAVRFAVVPRGKLVEGEYWAAMELESLAVNETVSKNEQTGRSVRLRTVTSILAPIFGAVGKVEYDGEIQDVHATIEKGVPVLKVLVVTRGSGRLGIVGNYEMKDASGAIVDSGSLPAAYVLRSARRWLTKRIQKEIPPGTYTVTTTFPAAHLKEPLTKTVTVVWPPAVAAGAETNEPAQEVTAEKTGSEPKGSTDGQTQPEARKNADK